MDESKRKNQKKKKIVSAGSLAYLSQWFVRNVSNSRAEIGKVQKMHCIEHYNYVHWMIRLLHKRRIRLRIFRTNETYKKKQQQKIIYFTLNIVSPIVFAFLYMLQNECNYKWNEIS